MGLLDQLREGPGYPWHSNMSLSQEVWAAEEAIWKSGHCSASTWRLQPNTTGTPGICAYETCVVDPPDGPAKPFNQQIYQLLIKTGEDSKDLKRSVQRLIWKLHIGAAYGLTFAWKQTVRQAIPLAVGLNDKSNQPSKAVVITSWRNWQMDFLLGFILLVASMLPLAKAVQERRRLKSLINKGSIWVHFAIDILLVECAAVGILTSLFLHEAGGRITGLRDFTLKEAIFAIDSIAHAVDPRRPHDYESKDLIADLGWAAENYAPDVWSTVGYHAVRSAKGLAAPLMVTGVFFLLFGIAVVVFCSLSTIFVRKTSVAQQMPWLTQWNAAIGGPLHLLGSVRDDEIKALSLRMQGQIILRGFLLTLFLGIFMFPVRSIDTAFATSLILGKQTSRTPWILSWFFFWFVHMVTGILAVNVINENHAFRDEDRWLRDMEAYGACGVPSQGCGMGMKPQGLPNTTAIPQSVPPGLQVQAQPPGIQVPQAHPPGLDVPQSVPPGLQVQAQPPGIQVRQAHPPGLQVPQSAPPGIQVRQAHPPGLQVPQSAPPGLQVPQAAPGARIPPGPPGMQAQQP